MAIREDELLEEETLHLPLTRPSLYLFIPYELVVLFGGAFFALDTQFHSLMLGFIVVPFWGAAAELVRRDANGVRVFMVRARLVLTMLDAWRWGGASASPFPLNSRRFRGIR